MSTPDDEIYAYTEAVWTADTGSGGIAESGGVAQVRSWFRDGDTNNRNTNWPKVVVKTVNQQEDDKMVASGGSPNTQQARMIVQFTVLTKADDRFSSQNKVVARLRDLFHKYIPTPVPSGDLWQFNEMVWVDFGQLPIREQDNEMAYFIRARVDARKVA